MKEWYAIEKAQLTRHATMENSPQSDWCAVLAFVWFGGVYAVAARTYVYVIDEVFFLLSKGRANGGRDCVATTTTWSNLV